MDSREYCDIDSNITLEYINRVLMEEDIDEKDIIYQEHDALQATEKPFYDILGQAYPSSAKEMVLNNDSTVDCPYGSSNNNLEGACCGSFVNGFLGPQVMHLTANHCASETDHLSSQFTKRAEEANRSVPIIEKLVVDLDSSELADSKQMTQATVGRKGKHVTQMMSHLHVNLELLDARNSNHLAIAGSEIIRNGSFDNVLLCTEQLYRDAAHLREMKAKEACDSSQNAQSKGYGQGQVKTRAKKQQEEAIDFRSLLIQCAEAIASNNQPFDRELLTKIRNHSSPNGDSSQRLAIYFVDALEARLAGTGSQMYHKLIAKRRSTTDMLKANRLCTAACPFTKCFANREGGPPNLRITVPRSHEARILIERDIIGANVFNVVACEGAERIEKPESYKKWQVRIFNAGFRQLPVNQTILKSSIERKELYHEDFVIDEDNGWLLQGWKG
nr:unnamed protein product [Digitaria exilis]